MVRPAQTNTPEVELLPHEAREEKGVGRVIEYVLTFGRALLIFTEIIVIALFFFRFTLDAQITDLGEEINRNRQILQSQKDLEAKLRVASSQVNFWEKPEKEKFLPQKVLSALEQITPQSVVFSELILDQEKLSISGQVLDNASFASLISALKNSNSFSKLSIDSVTQTPGGIKFNLTARVEKP